MIMIQCLTDWKKFKISKKCWVFSGYDSVVTFKDVGSMEN